MWVKLSFVVVLCSLTVSAYDHDFEGCKLYEVTAKNEEQARFLYELSLKSDKYDFWTLVRAVNVPTAIMVFPQYQMEFEKNLKANKVFFRVSNSNIANTLYIQKPRISVRSAFQTADFERYLRPTEINDYLDTLVFLYPDTVTVEKVGNSFEGREMKTIRITNGDKIPNKKVILIDAGIHAREWIAPAAAVYIINQLVENATNYQHLLKNFDWIILPLVNPDGYEYSLDHNRLWRKTRQPFGEGCNGTDGNRNFDFHWGEVGTSTLACHRLYRGPTPFSEPETRIVRDIMHSVNATCKMYLSLHSYGNYLLYPWGYSSTLPSNWKDMDEVAKAGADAIYLSTHQKYKVGSSTNVLYAAAGGSDDYAHGVVGIPIAITMELPGGGTGFDPYPIEISWMVEETWIGIEAMAKKVDEKYA